MQSRARASDSRHSRLPQYDFDSIVLLDRGCLLDPFLNPVPNLDPARHDVGMVMGACLWLPRSLWQELGGFPEWFGSVGEDLYLCCRARLAGYTVQVPDKSGYRHRVGQSFGGGKVSGGKLRSTYRRRTLTERNKTFVLVLTYPRPWMQLALPIHVLLLLVEGLLLSLVHRSSTYLTSIYLPVFKALYHRRRELMLLREEIARARKIGPIAFFAPFAPWPHKLKMLLRHGLPRLR